jgi:hypothetical protein
MPKTKTAPTFDARLHKGDKVTATVDLPGVPTGTTGRVKLVNGLTWTRYWVFFDNGVQLGQISQESLVRSKQWSAYQDHQANRAEAATATTVAASADGAAADAGAPAAGAGSKIPDHLLERARNRKKALGIE